MLPERGRLYLQTMVFGRNMIPLDEVDIHAPRDSDAWYLALMERQFPGSWLPLEQEQVVRCAAPHFRLLSSVSGRLDYIQTITRVGQADRGAEPEKDAAEAPARPPLADKRRLPPRVHLGCERQQGVL